MMKKLLLAALCAGFLIGCGNDSTPQAFNVNAATIADDAIACYKGEMVEQDTDTIARLLQVDSDIIEDSSCYTGKDEPEDLLFVVISDSADNASRVNDGMNYYLETLRNTASMYSPAQLQKVSEAYIVTKDTVSVMAIADDINAVKKVIAEDLK